jgi:hypothetical protein
LGLVAVVVAGVVVFVAAGVVRELTVFDAALA